MFVSVILNEGNSMIDIFTVVCTWVVILGVSIFGMISYWMGSEEVE
jgi:hypothetical protein